MCGFACSAAPSAASATCRCFVPKKPLLAPPPAPGDEEKRRDQGPREKNEAETPEEMKKPGT